MITQYYTLPKTEDAYLFIEEIENKIPCFTKLYWNEDEMLWKISVRAEDATLVENAVKSFYMINEENNPF